MKSYFKSKTMWVNFGIAVLGLLQPVLTEAPWEPATAGYIATGFAIVNMALRAVTTQALGSGE